MAISPLLAVTNGLIGSSPGTVSPLSIAIRGLLNIGDVDLNLWGGTLSFPLNMATSITTALNLR